MITPDRTVLSPNFNDAPVNGKTVVIHATRSGKPGYPLEMQGTLNWMSTPGTVSSHWVIGRDGEKVRVVPDNKQAWHAQEDNARTWGIELCQGVESDGFTNVQMASLAIVCAGYAQDFDVPLARAGNSTVGGFIGHQNTAQGIRNGKTDPGSLFDWKDLFARTSRYLSLAPTSEEQLDATHAMEARILAFALGRALPPMSARQEEVFDWLNKQPKR